MNDNSLKKYFIYKSDIIYGFNVGIDFDGVFIKENMKKIKKISLKCKLLKIISSRDNTEENFKDVKKILDKNEIFIKDENIILSGGFLEKIENVINNNIDTFIDDDIDVLRVLFENSSINCILSTFLSKE